MRFDAKKAELLDSEWRRKIFPPERIVKIVENLKIRKEVAFDIGAGTGYLTIPLARIFKKVYAVEASLEIVEILERKLKENNVSNVGIIVSEKPPEVEFEIDLVIFSNVLHELEDPSEYLEWAKKAKMILVAEWKKEEMDFGPPLEERLSLEELQKGYDLIYYEELPYHYVAVMKPSDK